MPMPLTRRRKRSVGRKKIILILAIFLFASLIFALILSPIFELKEISVYGNKKISSEDIKTNIAPTNILFLKNSEIENGLLKNFPQISEIKIEKNILKRSLLITVSERENAGIVCKEASGKCFYFDKNGVVFEEAPQTSGSLILSIKDFSAEDFFLGKKIYTEEIINAVIEIKEYLASYAGVKVDRFEIITNPPKEIKAITVKNWFIVFDPTRDTKKQLSILKTALDEKITNRENLEYIDLRIENRIYYK